MRLDANWREVFKFIRHYITNTVNEGLHSRIEPIKSTARGFPLIRQLPHPNLLPF
jgi:hypothetical protein